MINKTEAAVSTVPKNPAEKDSVAAFTAFSKE